MPDRFPDGLKRAATLCILQSERGLLLILRSKDPNRDRYTPLGGKIDPHERPADAARREVREEAGIDVRDLKLCGLLTETSPTRYNWTNYVYTAFVAGFDPGPCDEGTLAWVAADKLRDLPTPETDRFIYEAVMRGSFFVFDAVFDDQIRLLQMTDELSGDVLYTRQTEQDL